MSSRTYHGELPLDIEDAAWLEDPWLKDDTTARYGTQAARAQPGAQAVLPSARAWHTTGQWRTVDQRADAEVAKFWHAQDEAQRAKILHRSVEPRWLRGLAVVVGSLMCGVFARALLTPGAALHALAHSLPEAPAASAPAQPSAASDQPATLRIDTWPWSHVIVDDVPMGKTPQSEIQLQPGEHSVRLYNPELNLLKILTLRAQPGESIERVEQLER
jgi:PEGA domain